MQKAEKQKVVMKGCNKKLYQTVVQSWNISSVILHLKQFLQLLEYPIPPPPPLSQKIWITSPLTDTVFVESF